MPTLILINIIQIISYLFVGYVQFDDDVACLVAKDTPVVSSTRLNQDKSGYTTSYHHSLGLRLLDHPIFPPPPLCHGATFGRLDIQEMFLKAKQDDRVEVKERVRLEGSRKRGGVSVYRVDGASDVIRPDDCTRIQEEGRTMCSNCYNCLRSLKKKKTRSVPPSPSPSSLDRQPSLPRLSHLLIWLPQSEHSRLKEFARRSLTSTSLLLDSSVGKHHQLLSRQPFSETTLRTRLRPASSTTTSN